MKFVSRSWLMISTGMSSTEPTPPKPAFHQHVDAAEAVRGGGNRLIPIHDDADVQRQGKEPARIPFHELVERLWIASGRDDLMASSQRRLHDRVPQTHRTAGNEPCLCHRNLSIE